MDKKILVTGAVAGCLSVMIGAFGAHGLKQLVDAVNVASFETGVRYQMYHAIVLLILGSINFIDPDLKKRIFYFFLSGILLFSGSIYLLVLDQVLGMDFSSIGFITPIGGLLLIIGWVFAIISFMKIK